MLSGGSRAAMRASGAAAVLCPVPLLTAGRAGARLTLCGLLIVTLYLQYKIAKVRRPNASIEKRCL